MVRLSDYAGREQSYVKHVFLEGYLERLVHKTASTYSELAYVDGCAGPWQSASERFEDTSFGIALNALRRAKASWRERHRDVKMSAFLVERDADAYGRLAEISARYPDITIKTYHADFLTVFPSILSELGRTAFAFFLIDPKGWRIPLLKRQSSELIFNFMFDFINRAASIDDPIIVSGLDELIPYGNWRAKLADAEDRVTGKLDSTSRKDILVSAFTESLALIGHYPYVAETTILRPLSDRPLYCLCYATRSEHGIEVFRDCQIKALVEQAITRAATKMKHEAASTGQGELFESVYELGRDELDQFLENERTQAEITLLHATPRAPHFTEYQKLWPLVLLRHVVKLTDVNKISTKLRNDQKLLFPNWETGKRVPHRGYKVQRPQFLLRMTS
jgi:three-Cys-motif partner protein